MKNIATENSSIEEKIEFLKRNLQILKELEDDDQKNVLGNLMFLRVKQNVEDPDLVPKITGMLIDLEIFPIETVLEIIEKDDMLIEKIEEATEIIKEEDTEKAQ